MSFKFEESGHQVSEGHYIYQPHLINRSKSRPSPEASPSQASRPPTSRLPAMKTCLGILSLLSLVLLFLYGARAQTECPFIPNDKYAIIFDAGSTGSRIHIFSFRNNSGGLESGDHHQEELELEGEYYQEVKPGLSSYADNPLRAAFSLVPLLSAALKRVPSDRWATTPLLLKATAGLRLLTDAQANSILHEVEHLFRQYPFSVSPGAVSMMSGEDEGICGWITINYLLGKIRDQDKSVAALDLGGGSTQVTLIPNSPQTYSKAPPTFLTFRRYLDIFSTMYTHSYLGLGLMASRHSILSYSSSPQITFTNQTLLLQSPCIHQGVREIWTYGLHQYLLSTTDDGFDLAKCQDLASIHVANFKVNQPVELKSKDIVAVSYYYDRAVDLRLIGPLQRFAQVKVSDYIAAVKDACLHPQPDSHPLLCLDGIYITTLLTEGFGIDPQTTITVSKKIRGVETSWGLGGGLQAIYNNL